MTNEGISRLPTATGFAAETRGCPRFGARDIDPAPLLERLGLSEQDLNEDQIRVSAAAQARLSRIRG